MTNDEVPPIKEVAALLKLAEKTVYSMAQQGESPAFKVRGQACIRRSELDRWIRSELNQLVEDVTTALEAYNPTDAGRRMQDFVDDLSNWYVRRSRRRFWKSGVLSGPGGEQDADKLAAYDTLYTCLVALSKLLAP